ncbi:MAG: cyclic nucleotide-binding domain-containing protein, partial [Devosia sp.]
RRSPAQASVAPATERVMPSIIDLTAAEPINVLAPGETLVAEGASGGTLYVLISGTLSVERDGVKLATLTQPGTLIGEMSVLLGTPASANVRADSEARVRIIADAAKVLATDAHLATKVAATLASRLDATSALLVALSAEHTGKPHEEGLLSRIFHALTVTDDATVARSDLFGSDAWPRAM